MLGLALAGLAGAALLSNPKRKRRRGRRNPGSDIAPRGISRPSYDRSMQFASKADKERATAVPHKWTLMGVWYHPRDADDVRAINKVFGTPLQMDAAEHEERLKHAVKAFRMYRAGGRREYARSALADAKRARSGIRAAAFQREMTRGWDVKSNPRRRSPDAIASTYFAAVGPDAYHWAHTVTQHARLKDAKAEIAKRRPGWVFVITKNRDKPFESVSRRVVKASDRGSREQAERLFAATKRNPHHIDHAAYPERLKTLSDAALHYIIKDAQAAIRAHPSSEKAGYYADEVNYAGMELARRRKGLRNPVVDGPMHVYKEKRYAGIVWRVGAKRFHTFKAAAAYKEPSDEMFPVVNGRRQGWDTRDMAHPHTVTILPLAWRRNLR